MKFKSLFFTFLFVLSLTVISSATCETCSFTNGFCDICDAIQPAQVISSSHYSELSSTHSGYYAIENAGQLYWFAAQVNAGNTSLNACLVGNIKDNEVLSVSESRKWTPIGSKTLTYNGTFDGRGFEISGLYYTRVKYYDPSDTHVGLFGHIGSTAIVKNLGISGSSFSAHQYVGNIAGYSDAGSLITDCYSTSSTDAYDSCAGGIVGHNAGTVQKCYNTARITTTYDHVGGIVGYNTGLIKNCYNISDIASRGYIGGIVGCNGGQVENCFFIGECYDYFDSSYDPNMGYSSGTGAKFTNCYYQYDEAWTTIAGKTNKTAKQFASGEVAYLLGDAFGQNLDNGKTPDAHPVFADGENTVYKVKCGDREYYSNKNASYDGHIYDDCSDPDCNNCGYVRENVGHSFENGFCTMCGAYQPAQMISMKHYQELYLSHYGYYAIENAGQLYWFAEQVNAGNTSMNAFLAGNIKDNEVLSVSESRKWTPIGSKTLTYNGTFDGRGFEISGLYYTRVKYYDPYDTHVGLFGHIGSAAIVKNLGISGSSFSAHQYVGNIAGYSDAGSLITDCYSTSSTDAYDSCAGGIVGHNAGTVQKCYNTARITTTYDHVGGIAGYNTGLIKNCYSICNIASRGYMGGIVGCNGGQVENCFFIGECYDYFDSSYDPNMGYSYGTGATFTNCYYQYDEAWTTIAGKTNKTAKQFASGEVAYLLGDAFGQNLDNGKTPDAHPVFADGENKVLPGLTGYTNRIIGGNVGGGSSGGGGLVIVTPKVSLTQTSVTATGIGGSPQLVLACYDGDKFVSSSVTTISADTTLTLPEYPTGYTVKAFLLSTGGNPLCESASIVIE